MASFVFDSFWEDLAKSPLDLDDNFKLMLVNGLYVPDKAAHTRRNQVTNEITGSPYTAGGILVPVTVTKRAADHKIFYTFDAVTFPSGSITANAGVCYRARGGASSADELVFYNDFGGAVTVNPFVIAASQIEVRN